METNEEIFFLKTIPTLRIFQETSFQNQKQTSKNFSETIRDIPGDEEITRTEETRDELDLETGRDISMVCSESDTVSLADV